MNTWSPHTSSSSWARLQHPLRVRHEEEQQAKFGRVMLHRLAVGQHAMGRRVQAQCADFDGFTGQMRRARRRSTARMRATSSFGENGLVT